MNAFQKYPQKPLFLILCLLLKSINIHTAHVYSKKKATQMLRKAIVNQDIKKTKAAISYGADIHSVDKFWFTPLHLAAEIGHVEIVDILLKNDANTAAKTKIAEQTAGDIARFKGHTAITKLLQP